MRKVLEVARHEFIISLRRPSFIIATLAIPLLGLVGLIVAAYFGGQAGEVSGYDHSHEPYKGYGKGGDDKTGTFQADDELMSCYFQDLTHRSPPRVRCHCERSEAIPYLQLLSAVGIASSLRSY